MLRFGSKTWRYRVNSYVMAKILNISLDSISRTECSAFGREISLAFMVSGVNSVIETSKTAKTISIKAITFR